MTRRVSQEEWDREAARVARPDGVEDAVAGGVYAAGGLVHRAKHPVPDTAGLTPEETEAVLARWRGQVHSYLDSLEAQRPTASDPPAPAAR